MLFRGLKVFFRFLKPPGTPRDLAGLAERELCDHGADNLINDRCTENDGADLRRILRDDDLRDGDQTYGHTRPGE